MAVDVGGGDTVRLTCDNKSSHVLRDDVIAGVYANDNYQVSSKLFMDTLY